MGARWLALLSDWKQVVVFLVLLWISARWNVGSLCPTGMNPAKMYWQLLRGMVQPHAPGMLQPPQPVKDKWMNQYLQCYQESTFVSYVNIQNETWLSKRQETIIRLELDDQMCAWPLLTEGKISWLHALQKHAHTLIRCSLGKDVLSQ